MNVAAYLELLGRPFTGTGSHGLYLAQDKALAKKIFAFHGIRTPNFMTGYRGRLDWAHDIHFPCIVKPALEDGSIGIRFSAVVGSLKELMERIDGVHAEFDAPVLIEEYIEGREIYVAVIGNRDPEALPIVELDLSQLPKGTPRIAGTEVKWEHGTAIYRNFLFRVCRAEPTWTMENFIGREVERIRADVDGAGVLCALSGGVDSAVTAAIVDRAVGDRLTCVFVDNGVLRANEAERVASVFRGRFGDQGDAYVIEVNPNPWLLSTAEFAKAAKKSGRQHCQLVGEIVELAMSRYGA